MVFFYLFDLILWIQYFDSSSLMILWVHSHHSDRYSIDHLPRCQLVTWTPGLRRNFQRVEVVWISPGCIQFVFQETRELGWHHQWNGWVLWLWECEAGELHCAAVHGGMYPVNPHCDLGWYGWRGSQNVGDGDSETLCSLSCLWKCMSWSQLKWNFMSYVFDLTCTRLILVQLDHLSTHDSWLMTHCFPIKTFHHFLNWFTLIPIDDVTMIKKWKSEITITLGIYESTKYEYDLWFYDKWYVLMSWVFWQVFGLIISTHTIYNI